MADGKGRIIVIFLLDYDRSLGALVNIKTFADDLRADAERERLQLELSLNRSGVIREVVLLEAPDEQSLRRTHRRYFENFRELVKSSTGGLG